MALSIINWNIAENRLWFVRLADTGSEISAELYLSAADAQAQTSRQASGVSTGYGSALDITLANDAGATVPVSLFQSAYAWHLIMSGANGDATKIFQIKQFVELDEIAHPIYRASELIELRAAAEINAHTHAKVIRSIPLAIHTPTLEPGDIVRIQSTRRGLDAYAQVSDMQITGTPNSLTTDLEAVSYQGLKR